MNSRIHLQPPSKKIIIFIGLVIAFFIGFFGYKPFIEAYRNGNFNGSLSYSINGSQTEIDSDNDGLPDWQETIWKTDLNNADSDNDGTSDGEEAAVGRDPRKAGPDDTIDSLSDAIAVSNSIQYLNDPNNLSQALAQQIFTKSLSTGETIELGADTEAEVIANTLSTFQGQAIPLRYSLSDIKTTLTTDKVAIKNFGTSMITLQDALFNLSETASDSDVDNAYSTVISGMLNLAVPKEMAGSYLMLINNTYIMQKLYARIITEYDDPVRIYIDNKNFQDITMNNRDIYKKFATYFRNNGIIWGKNEAGDVWNNY